MRDCAVKAVFAVSAVPATSAVAAAAAAAAVGAAAAVDGSGGGAAAAVRAGGVLVGFFKVSRGVSLEPDPPGFFHDCQFETIVFASPFLKGKTQPCLCLYLPAHQRKFCFRPAPGLQKPSQKAWILRST